MTTSAKQRDLEVAGAGARTAAWPAWALCAVTLLVLASALLLIFLGWSTPLPRAWTPWREQVVSLVGVLGAPVLGGLIASRRPENPYGWLWLAFGFCLALQLLAESYAAYALKVAPGSLPAPRSVSQLLALGGPLALTSGAFLFLLFPTGWLPSRRWRPLAWVVVISGGFLFALNLLFDSPEKVGGAITAVVFATVIALFAAILFSALSLVVRYRRAGGMERQQLKWFAAAAVLAAAYIIFGELLGLKRLVGGTVWNLLDAATNMALYAAVGIAVLRHRLYDIDLLINRALVYGSLTVLLAATYFGGVVGSQYAFRAVTGQGSTLAVVASTLTIAALFNPLRKRVQALVDRRFYRRKYDAAKTLEAFNSRLREETDLDTLSDDLVRVARGTMQPEHASLWLRPVAAEQAD